MLGFHVRRLATAISGIVICVAPCVHAQRTGLDARALRKLERTFDGAFRPGDAAAGLIARDGVIVFERGFGRTDEGGRAVTSKSLFDAGPVAQSFTAAAILRLSMQGRLALDDPIEDHLPEVPAQYRLVKIRHLLSHTSGLPLDVDFLEVELADRGRFLQRVLSRPTHVRPGRYLQPNPLNGCVAAAVVEEVSGKPFEEFVAKELLARARMRDTAFVGDPSIDVRDAVARYDDGDAGRVGHAGEGAWHWGVRGRTGIVTSVRDLHRWNEALKGVDILDLAHRDELFSPYVGDQALFWKVETGRDLSVVAASLGGETTGFRSRLTYFIAQDTLIVLLANTGTADLDALHDDLTDLLFTDAVDPTELDHHSGRYKLDSRNWLDVAVVDGRLQIRALGQEASSRLYHGQPTMPEWPSFYKEVAQRAPVLLRPMLQKDLESFSRSFHTGAPRGAAEAGLDIVEMLEDELGKVGRAELIGTRQDGPLASWFRVEFGRSHATLRVEWHGEVFDRVTRAVSDYPVAIELLPAGENEFTASSMDGKGRVRVVFKGRDGAPSDSLRFHDKSKAGKRGIKCKRVRGK